MTKGVGKGGQILTKGEGGGSGGKGHKDHYLRGYLYVPVLGGEQGGDVEAQGF